MVTFLTARWGVNTRQATHTSYGMASMIMTRGFIFSCVDYALGGCPITAEIYHSAQRHVGELKSSNSESSSPL